MAAIAEEIIETIQSEYDGEIMRVVPIPVHDVRFTVPAEDIVDFCQCVVDNGWWHLSTISGRDTGEEIVLDYHFCSDKEIAITVQTKIGREDPSIASLTSVVPGSTLYERELHDLLGVVFEGHGNLQPLVLPEDWPEDKCPLRVEEVEKRTEEDETNV